MPNEVRGRLDSAIDRAVRAMMHVDPLPGLRHRVAGRLESPVRRSWTIPAFATAAAMLVLIVALALLRDPETQQRPAPRVTTAAPVAPAVPPAAAQTEPAATPEVAASAAASEGPRPRTAESIFGNRTGRVSAANLASDAVAPEAVEIIVVPPVEPPQPGVLTSISPITIAPITVTPIRLQPLALRPVRDQR